MKKTSTLFLLVLCLLMLLGLPELQAQVLSTNQVYDIDRITGQHDRGHLIDIDGDGDMDFLVGAGTNNTRLQVFINSITSMDSVYILDDYSDEFGLSGLDEIVVADFDNDGDHDIVVEVGGHNSLFLHENLGNGFADRVLIISSSARNLAYADVDNDGLQDLLIGAFSPDNLLWSKNLGSLNFDTSILLIEEDPNLNLGRITDIRVVDMEGDGDDDIIIIRQGVTASQGVAFISVNDGVGNFTSTQMTEIPNIVSSFAIEDFNGDGHKDFGLSQILQSGTIRGRADIYWNDQTNAFPTSTNIRSYPLLSNGTLPNNLAGFYAVDIDDDNDLDIITGETFQNTYGTAELQLNDGSGNFINQGTIIENTLFSGFDFGNGLFIPEVFVNDFNDDGRKDVLTMTSADRDIILHTQNLDGTFNSDQYLNHSLESLNRLQFIDVNKDSFNDIVAIDGNQNGKVTASLGDGKGNFNEQIVLFDSIPLFPDDAMITDLDGNGELDILFASSKYLNWKRDFITDNEPTAEILFTSDPSSLGSGRMGITNFTSNTLDVKDVDNDGDLDVLFIEAKGSSTDRAYFLKNNGDNTFTTQLINGDNDNEGSLVSYVFSDLNNDNLIELISAELVNGPSQTYNVNVHSYNATMDAFEPTQSLEIAGYSLAHQFTTGDPDNDGDQDVIFGGLLWLQNDAGVLLNAEFLIDESIQYTPVSEIITADINQDGLDDFISNKYVGGQTQRIVTLINQGNNEFSFNEDYIVEQIHARQTFIAEDIDTDGVLDIISSDINSGSGSFKPVWLRTCFPTFSDTQVVSSCDSYVSPSGKFTWTTTGTYTDTLLNVLKCDSIITFDLTILESTSSAITEVACDSYTAPDGSIFELTGMYEVTVPNTVGCDSLISINLTVNQSSTSNLTEVVCDSYTAPDGSVFDTTGLYDVTILNTAGCDSLISIDLTVNTSTSSDIAESACESYSAPDGTTYTTSGVYQATIQNMAGCDSLINIDLTINFPTESNISVEACESYSAPDGSVLTTTGLYDVIIPNSAGCDSLINIDLTVNMPTESSIIQTSCDSYSAPDGSEFTTSGIYSVTIPNTLGCDSLINIDLTINESTIASIMEETCDSYTAPDGNMYTESGIYEALLVNQFGCDSLLTIDLTINQLTESSIEEIACDSYTAPDGSVFTVSGEYNVIIPNTVGCDSLINIVLTIDEATAEVTREDNTLIASQDNASYQWLNCGNDNQPIEGETSQSFSPQEAGSYAVMITTEECMVVSECLEVEQALGVESQLNAGVYPNPSNGSFTINFKSAIIKGNYQVIDLLGKIKASGELENQSQIDISLDLPQGVYLLNLTDQMGTKTSKKIVIK